MKWLLLPLAWLAAAGLAVWVAWRLWRGRPVVLRGRFSPRVVRLAVLFLLLFGVGSEDKAVAAPVPGPGKGEPGTELPPSINEITVSRWLQLQTPGGPWPKIKANLTLLPTDPKSIRPEKPGLPLDTVPPRFRALVTADLKAWADGKAGSAAAPAELVAVLDEMEAHAYYDHWLTAYLWRKSATDGPAKDRAVLYARLHRHARVTDALLKARFAVNPVLADPRAWMSKAGPNQAQREQLALARASLTDTVKTARAVYPATDGGTWRHDALVLLKVGQGSVALTWHRGDRRTGVPEGETLRFGRLDLLEAAGQPVVLEHLWLGRMKLPAGTTVTAWELHELLSDEARDTVRRTVRAALDGDEKAAERLEEALPLVQVYVRSGLTGSPQAKGAPRLRLILTLFDDALMPEPPVPK
jgi:hypothetical protein